MSDTTITILGVIILVVLLIRSIYWERRLKQLREGTNNDESP